MCGRETVGAVREGREMVGAVREGREMVEAVKEGRDDWWFHGYPEGQQKVEMLVFCEENLG